MKSVNFVAITGIVTGVSFNANTVRKRPVVQMTMYSESTEQWTSQVYVIFSGDAMAKKSQGIGEGDIIAVFGALSHDGVKVCVYCDTFLSLVKTPQPVEEFYQRPTLLGFRLTPNKVFLLGTVTQSTGRLLTIRTGQPFSIEGEVSTELFAPVVAKEGSDASLGDEVLFIGDFANEGVVGEARVVEKRTESKAEDFQ